jgi:hypothetical protein
MRRAAETEIDIDAPPSRVWAVMLDFTHYHEWNPFIVRAELSGPPVVGAALRLHVRWHDGGGASSGERITELVAPTDCEPGRLAYDFTGFLPAFGLVRATRLQRLDPLGSDRTRYFTRENFSGLLTLALPLARVQDGFERHAKALKVRAEAVPRRPPTMPNVRR